MKHFLKKAAQGYLQNVVFFVSFIAISLTCVTLWAAPKPMINYFQPIPIVGKLTTSGWGYTSVGPRDSSNGIEDLANYRYWDGKIIKAGDGKYHLFCSRWPASAGLAGWMNVSVSVHAISDSNILGPYKFKEQTYTYQNGKGHNTTGITLVDGTYAVIESAIVPGWIFTSSSLNGPFNYLGQISWNNNGFNTQNITSNLQIIVGPDKRYWTISQNGFVMNGDNILGTYTCRTASIYPTIAGTNNNTAEDPIIWYSGGYYHVVYNYWDIRRGYHLMSKDGISNWINTGVALDRSTNFIRYTDGTVNHWGNMERPNVFMVNGHVAYFTFAVTDKAKDSSNASTGSKVIVVPFDGVGFDADNGGETAVSRVAGGRDADAGGSKGTIQGGPVMALPQKLLNGNRLTYDLSGRAVGNKNPAKPGIYIVPKTDSHEAHGNLVSPMESSAWKAEVVF